MPISSCLQMKKVYKVWGIHHPKAKKRKLPMPYAAAVTSLQAQPRPASHENAFPDAIELRDAVKCQDRYLKSKRKPKNTTGIETCPNPLEASSAQTGYHARRMHRAFHIRTLKAVKKVVNRDERRLRAGYEEKSTLSIMLTGSL
jgi:hypothetical protein